MMSATLQIGLKIMIQNTVRIEIIATDKNFNHDTRRERKYRKKTQKQDCTLWATFVKHREMMYNIGSNMIFHSLTSGGEC